MSDISAKTEQSYSPSQQWKRAHPEAAREYNRRANAKRKTPRHKNKCACGRLKWDRAEMCWHCRYGRPHPTRKQPLMSQSESLERCIALARLIYRRVAAPHSPPLEKPPAYVAEFTKAVYPNYTGYWMGWHWVNGKVVGKAPPVER